MSFATIDGAVLFLRTHGCSSTVLSGMFTAVRKNEVNVAMYKVLKYSVN